jgi:hypothetical protein
MVEVWMSSVCSDARFELLTVLVKICLMESENV